jgi:type 2 lantibiotic biosynthesis protein LanM
MTNSVDSAVRWGGRRWDDRLTSARSRSGLPLRDRNRWRDALDPYNTGAWDRRIAWGELGGRGDDDGVKPDSDSPPPWLRELELIRSAARAATTTVVEHSHNIPFAEALQPVVDQAWTAVHPASVSAGLAASAQANLRLALLRQLSEIAAQPLGRLFCGERTLADVAMAHIIDGQAAGSSRERYKRFCQAQLASGFEGSLIEFPVLGRLLATVVTNWYSACHELLTRLTSDRAEVERVFDIPRRSSITSLATGLSDPHRGGRSVVVVTFDTDARLVYKPHSVDIEARFQNFVATLSSALPENPLRRLAVLQRDVYGYVEHVESKGAAHADGRNRFYRNAGRTLAILYLLGATDCHWENMIADDDQLVLVDAETLLEGIPIVTVDRPISEGGSLAADSIAGSVLGTGMLPSWISVGPARSIDVSALGVPGSEQDRVLAPDWCFINTDDMVWGEREVAPPHPACLPVGPGNPNPLSEHGGDLIAGFAELMTVVTSRHVYLRARAELEAFRGAKRRIVVRPTRTYVLLQRQALDHGALRDSDERALQLDLLTRAYIGGTERPLTWPLAEREIAACESLDVPYFEGIVGSTDLLVGNEVVVEGYYQEEGLQRALDRLDRASRAETRWQCRLIQGAISAHRFEMSATRQNPRSERQAAVDLGVHDAHDVAQLIATEVLEQPTGPPTWLTVTLMSDSTRVQLGLVPPGLYDGRAGIAAFLSDCGDKDLAAKVLRPVLDALADPDMNRASRYMRGVGLGLSGVGGLLRLFRYHAEDGACPSTWMDRSHDLIGALSDELLTNEDGCDLVSGVAGLVAPIAAFHKSTPTRASQRVLSKVGRLLLDRQNAAGGWSMGPEHPPLAGLSHGASGVAVALAELAVALEDDRFATAGAAGIAFESRLFESASLNWPDLRSGIAPANRLLMRSWCHGSVGVALARSRMLDLLNTHDDAARWREELTVAVESSISAPMTPADHLCCGNIGRAVVITLAGQTTGSARWEAEGIRLGAAVRSAAGSSPANYRLLLGINGTSGLRLPGLMTGLAGIGMYLLHGPDLRWARHLLI